MEKVKIVFILVMIILIYKLIWYQFLRGKCGIVVGIRQSYLRLWRGNLLEITWYAALRTTSLTSRVQSRIATEVAFEGGTDKTNILRTSCNT